MPPMEPLVIVASLLIALIVVFSIIIAYVKDSQPRRPSYMVETAQQNLYQQKNPDPSFLDWLAGGSNSYVNQAKAWLQRPRSMSRQNTDYEPLVNEQDDPVIL